MRENRRLSPKELAARRNNAQKSTGPRTEAGKPRSALNALKHGRYAKAPLRPLLHTIVALGGDLKDFTSLFLSITRSYVPVASADPNSRRGVERAQGVAPLYEPVASPDVNLRIESRHSQDAQKGRGRGERT